MHGRALSTETTVWNFGSVKRGDTVTRTVVLRNSAAFPLHLEASSSCDCLAAELEGEILPGGSAVSLHLSFLGDAIKEKTTKTVYVRGRDYSEEKLEITVTGRVTRGDVPHLDVVPTIVLFEGKEGAHGPANLTLRNLGRADLEITEVRCFGCVAVSGVSSLGEDEHTEMEVILDEGWTQENRWLEIDCNDPLQEMKKVPIMIMD